MIDDLVAYLTQRRAELYATSLAENKSPYLAQKMLNGGNDESGKDDAFLEILDWIESRREGACLSHPNT